MIPSGLACPDALRRLAPLVLDPRHFHVAPELSLELQHEQSHTQSWEVFHGRLLDPAHTRQEGSFEEWNLFLVEEGDRSREPLLALKFDAATERIHLVRAVLCHAWEGYDSGGGVCLSRETTRWVRELCGSFGLRDLPGTEELLDELVCRVFHAVIGASRLPLTSVETPLPQFALGRVTYRFEARGEILNPLERIKGLEILLHTTSVEQMPRLARELSAPDALGLLGGVFNEVSLTPWTDLTEKSLLLLDELERQQAATAEQVVDFLADRILQVTRHLTAYDLVTFHHRGANYPDALLLDSLLKELLRRTELHPHLLLDPAQRVRRRALRQGWLLRRFHEGLPVPDAPTSPGENVRVLPPPHKRVDEGQILQTTKRRRLLHADDPLPRHLGPGGAAALRLSTEELSQPAELIELGLALFLDRPLGSGKQPGEPDQTILLSHRAFSRSLARRRLRFLVEKLDLLPNLLPFEAALEALAVEGVPLSALAGQSRPGTVAVADARQVADDFLFLSTTPATVRELYRQYDFGPLQKHLPTGRVLLVPLEESGALTLHDSRMHPWLLLVPDLRSGYVSRAGREVLRAGLHAIPLEGDVPVPRTLLPCIATGNKPPHSQ